MSNSTLERYGYILTIEEHYWNRFNKPDEAGKPVHAYVSSADILKDKIKLLFFYSVGQHKDIVGFADFIERKLGETTQLWNLLGKETCLKSLDEYIRVTRGNKNVIFIRFKNLHQGTDTVALNQIYEVLSIDRMPQTGMYINKSQAELLVKLLK